MKIRSIPISEFRSSTEPEDFEFIKSGMHLSGNKIYILEEHRGIEKLANRIRQRKSIEVHQSSDGYNGKMIIFQRIHRETGGPHRGRIWRDTEKIALLLGPDNVLISNNREDLIRIKKIMK